MAVDPFGIGIKIVWTTGDIDAQIRNIQTYLNGKNLNVGLTVNPNALKGFQQQIDQTTSKVNLFQETMKNKLANLQIGKGSIFSQSGIQAEMNKFLEQLALVGTTGGKSTQELRLQFAQLSTSVRSAASDISMVNREADGFGTTIVKDFGKMMAWTLVATAMYAPLRAIKEGIQDVISLNTNLTQTATAMNTTVDKLGAIATGAQTMAVSMGASVTDVLQIMHVYANVNETASSIIQKTQADVVLSNLSGLGGQETTNILQGVQQQFNLADDQLMHVDDAMTKIASNLRVNYQTAIKEIGAGVKTAGTMAEQAGLSFEKFASIIGVTEEKTRRSGSEIANAMKQIFARVGQIKSPDVEVTGVDLSNSAKALSSIGVDTLDPTTHQLRNIDDIFTDISKKWDTLSSDQKAYVSFNAAATRQYSLFESIMQGYAKSTDLSTQALNANGYALKQQTTYMESTEAKIKTLQSTIVSMWQSSINSDFINGAISGLTDLTKTFMNLPGIILTIVTALSLWKGANIATWIRGTTVANEGWRVSLISTKGALIGMTEAEIATATATKGLALTMNTLKVAFATNPIGFIATALLTLWTAFDIGKGVVNGYAEAQKKAFDDLVTSVTSLKTELTQLPDLISQYKTLSTQTLQTASDKQKLADVTSKLAQMYPEAILSFTNEGQAAQLDIPYIQQLTKAKQDLLKVQQEELASKFKASGNSDLKNLQDQQQQMEKLNQQIKDYQVIVDQINSGQRRRYATPVDQRAVGTDFLKEYQKDIADVVKQKATLEATIQSTSATFLSGAHAVDQVSDSVNKLSLGMQNELKTSVLNAKGSMDDFYAATKVLEDNNISKSIQDITDHMNAMSTDGKSTSEDIKNYLTKEIENLEAKYKSLGIEVPLVTAFLESFKKSLNIPEITNAKSQIDSVDTSLKSLLASVKDNIANVESYNNVLDKLANGQSISASEAIKLIEANEKWGSAIKVVNGVVEINREAVEKLRQEEIQAGQDKINVGNASINSQITETQNFIDSTQLRIEAIQAEKTALKDKLTVLAQAGDYNAGEGLMRLGSLEVGANTDLSGLKSKLEGLKGQLASTNLMDSLLSSDSLSSTSPVKAKKEPTSSVAQQVSIEDSLIKSFNTQVEITQQQEKLLNKQIATTKSQKDYNSELSLTNDLIKNQQLQVTQLGVAKSKIESEFAKVSSESGFENTSQFVDQQGNATLYYQNLWNASSVETQKQLTALFDKLSKLQKAWYDNANSVDTLTTSQKALADSILSIKTTIADETIAIYKKAYAQEKEIAIKTIDSEITALQTAHDTKIKLLDEEQKKIDDVINAKIKSLELDQNSKDYAEQLSTKQTEAQDLQSKINVLSLDNSIEAKAQRTDLTKQLTTKQTEISDLQYKHDIDLRKQSLQDELTATKTQTDATKTAEQTSYDTGKKALEQRKVDLTYFYDEQINNEKNFAQIKEDINKGNLETIKTQLLKFSAEFKAINKDTAKSLGISYQGLQSLSNEAGSTTVAKTNVYGNKTDIDLAKGVPNSSKFNFITVLNGDASMSKSGDFVLGGSAVIKNAGQGEQLSGYTSADTLSLFKQRTSGFSEGGETSKTGAHWLDGKLGQPERVLSSEQTFSFNKLVDYLPKLNSLGNMIGNFKTPSFTNNFSPSTASSPTYNLNLNIENLTGSKSDANMVFNTIVQGLKKMGVK